jgi:nucleotide-binding universal stress UspA family protein
MTVGNTKPIVFAYDGSELAKEAIDEAGRQLPDGREALILTVWQPANVGFIPPPGLEFDAACADDVRRAAEETAAQGAALAESAGFRARGVTNQAAPTWKGVCKIAEEHDASLIVLGSHGRSGGIAELFIGSVAGTIAARTKRPVLIVHGHQS